MVQTENIDAATAIAEAGVMYNKGRNTKALAYLEYAIQKIKEEGKHFEFPGKFIVIETHGGAEFAIVCMKPSGENEVFNDKKEAEKFARDECQMGIVVEV